MSKSEIDRFVNDLKNDPTLQGAASSGTVGLHSLVEVAKSKGYDITMDEAKAYVSEQADKELSDDELDAVAGGKSHHHHHHHSVVTHTVEAVNTATSVATVAEEAVAAATTVAVAAEAVAVAT